MSHDIYNATVWTEPDKCQSNSVVIHAMPIPPTFEEAVKKVQMAARAEIESVKSAAALACVLWGFVFLLIGYGIRWAFFH